MLNALYLMLTIIGALAVIGFVAYKLRQAGKQIDDVLNRVHSTQRDHWN